MTMHKEGDFDIDIKHLSKIEGHTDLEVRVKDGKVQYAHLKISESKRFFTQGVRGKPALSVAQLVSRICGTCSIAHLQCCIEAVEDAIGVQPSEQTILLRHLTNDGLMIRDHAMHLYIFTLPDIMNADSVLEIAERDRSLIEKALEVKSAGNELSKLVAGRSVHAPYPQVGGFTKVPSNDDARKMAHILHHAREHAIEFVELFRERMPFFSRKTHFIALKNPNYEFIGGELCSSEGYCIPHKDFWNHLDRVVVPYSQATGFEFEGREYMVGALSRMNLNKDALHQNTRRDLASTLSLFPSSNIYMNNLAQAVEIVHCIDHAIERLESFDFKPEPYKAPQVKAGTGIGVTEAPRGTLYYALKVNEQGQIDYINLVIPTAQNFINIEKDIAQVVQESYDAGRSKEEISMEVEKLVRAYDPCMSCATHFLKLKWKETKGTPRRPKNPWLLRTGKTLQ
ncbi:MAG: nickel-dependent hydrogenase large subunit [Candidatus Micrarchaeota archaeon]|nr:nickel-dependent hydrogenase large subunit [Candidatus Micrarchaeota archaeon]